MAGQDKSDGAAKALRNAFKASGIEVRHWPPGRQKFTRQVAAFFLRWTCERLLSSSEKRTTRPRRGKARSHAVWSGALSCFFFWISISVSHIIVLFRDFFFDLVYVFGR